MKAVFLLVCIALFLASAKVIPMNKKLARTIAPETVALEIVFQGTCEEFRNRVLASVRISNYANCLPLQPDNPGFPVNPDIDDLHTHYFCTDVARGRSVQHFVEIFAGSDDVQVPDFILSLQPTAPIRVTTKGVSLSRIPDCVTTQDYCNGTNYVVSGCRTNNVIVKENWVVNNDRIYITSNQKVTNDCKDNQVCCNYITPSLFGGICARTANDELLAFQEREGYRPEHKPEHRPQEEHRPERPQEHRPQESGYGRPQEEEHRPEHRPGQGRPGHGRPGHGRPQEEHRPKPGPHRDEEEEDKKRTEQKPAAPKQEEKKEDEEEED